MNEGEQTSQNQTSSGARNGFAVASLVLGIIGLLSSFLVIGAVFALIGVVLGVVAIAKKQPKGLAVTGVVLSIIALLISVVIGFLVGGLFSFLRDTTDSFDIEDNGITIESEDGDSSFSLSGELPDNFPEEVPIYEPSELQSSTSFTEDGSEIFNVSFRSQDDAVDILGFYEVELEQDGWELDSDWSADMEGQFASRRAVHDGGLELQVTIRSHDNEDYRSTFELVPRR